MILAFFFLFRLYYRILLLRFWFGTMSALHQVFENGLEHVELLPATNDNHGGVIVEMEGAMGSEVFATLLRASVSEWRRQVVICYSNLLYKWMGLLHYMINGLTL